MMVKCLFWSSLLLIAYSYVAYPILLWVACRLRRAWDRTPSRADAAPVEWPTVTMLVAAHNEAGVIREKIANCLALNYPRDRFRVVIASDGSQDGTNEIVAACQDPRIQLIAYPQRRGKIATLNATIPT